MIDLNSATGWSPEFGERLSLIFERIGSKRASAEVVGYSEDQLSNWRSGRSKIPLVAAARLCVTADVPLDWLCGLDRREPSSRSDDRIQDAVENSVRYILGAAQFFGRNDPNDIAPAAAKRTLFLLECAEGHPTKPTIRLTRSKKTSFD